MITISPPRAETRFDDCVDTDQELKSTRSVMELSIRISCPIHTQLLDRRKVGRVQKHSFHVTH